MLEKIINIAREYCEEDDIEINEDTRVLEDLEFSSMEFFSFISDIEEECGISIPEKEIKKIETIKDIVDLVEA